MATHDFTDPIVRAEYFQPTEGRPHDRTIISSIREMVAFVGPHALPDDPFKSNDMCLSIWDDYPNQHVYIGHRVSRLEEAGKLPIGRLGTRNNRVFYAIFS
jgi:hypothetical protein